MNKGFGIIAVSAVMLSGCGLFGDTFRDRADDYQLAEETALLQVPEGLDGQSIAEIYAIPAISDDTLVPGEFVVPRPLKASTIAFEQQVKIQTLGDRSWALVQTAPSQSWPRVRNVLNRNGIPAARLDAPHGILETVWVDFNDDPDNSYRFRIKIEPGVQLNSTEISVLENHAAKAQRSKSVWLEPSMDAERESEILKLIAETLAGDLDSGSVSLLAQSIGGEQKVDVVNPKDATPYMLIKLDFERSWASVGYAAERGGFTSVDKDRSSGLYYVSFDDDEGDEKPGFFSGLFGADEVVEIVEADYRIKLIQQSSSVKILIHDKDDKELERFHALYLLKTLRANLS